MILLTAHPFVAAIMPGLLEIGERMVVSVLRKAEAALTSTFAQMPLTTSDCTAIGRCLQQNYGGRAVPTLWNYFLLIVKSARYFDI